MANKKTSSKTTIVESTNDGKKGGLLDGKRHYDKDGKPLGGIKAIVTDTGQIVELEGGEVIINREASKLHWRELSRINQSAGDGVPILPPDVVNDDTEEYKNGGNTFDFNPNKIPTKWVYEYALKIKENYPKVWNLAEDKYSNEAFKNLSNVYKRGSWLDGEEWFYYKWRVYPQKQKNTKTLVGVLNSLKWCNITKEGWRYMKNTIEKAIKKHYPKKYMEGGKFPILTEKSKQKLAPTFIDEKLPKNRGVGSVIERTEGMTLYTPFQINEILIRVGLPLRVIKDIGMGLYGNAFTTDRDSVLKVSYSSKEAYASFMIMQGDYESQVKVFNVFKITNADNESLYFIEKEYVKVAEKILEGLREPFDEYFKELYRLDDYKLNDKLGEKIKDEDLRNYAKTFYDNFETRNSIATNLVSKKLAFEKFSKEGGLDQKNLAYIETEIDSYRDFIQNKEQILDETYRYLVFLNQIAIDKEYIDIDDYHTGNFGKIGDKYVCFDCSHSSFRAFLNGGNITNTYAYVEATTDKGRKVYRYFDHEPTHQEVYDYFKKIKEENGVPINIVDATINVEKLTDFNAELFLNHADKVVREKYGVGIKDKDDTIISFDADSFNVNEFVAELENGKLVTIGSVDGVVIIQEKYETGGQMQGEPPANFENVLWNNLVSRYKQGGEVGLIECENCGWSWKPEESEKHDLYVCHECNQDNEEKYVKGGKVVTWKNKYNKKYGYDKNESHDIKEISKDTGVSIKGLQQIYNKGVGAYNTNPQSVRPNVKSEEQWAMGRVYSAVMGGKASKVDANELKMRKGGVMGDIFSIEDPKLFKQILTIYNDFTDKFGIDNYFIDHNDNSVVFLRKTNFSGTEIANMEKKVLGLRDNFDVLGNKKPNAWGNNFKFYLNSDIKYKNGGGVDSELAKGIETEKEHLGTIKKIYDHKVPLNKAPELIAKDHIEENPKYYTKLAKMEQKFSGGGNISVGDEVTFLMRGATEPTDAVVIKKGTCKKSGKCTAVVKFKDTGRQLEVYETRLTKKGSDTQIGTGVDLMHLNFVKGVWQYYQSKGLVDLTFLLCFDRMEQGVMAYTEAIIIERNEEGEITYAHYIKDGRLGTIEIINKLQTATQEQIGDTFTDYCAYNQLYKAGDIIYNDNIGGAQIDGIYFKEKEIKSNYIFAGKSTKVLGGGYTDIKISADNGKKLIYNQSSEDKWAITPDIQESQKHKNYVPGMWYYYNAKGGNPSDDMVNLGQDEEMYLYRIDKVVYEKDYFTIFYKDRIRLKGKYQATYSNNASGVELYDNYLYEGKELQKANKYIIENFFERYIRTNDFFVNGDVINNTNIGGNYTDIEINTGDRNYAYDENTGALSIFGIDTSWRYYESEKDSRWADIVSTQAGEEPLYIVGRWYSFKEQNSERRIIVRVGKVDKFPGEYAITFKERIIIDKQINEYEFTNGDGHTAFGTLSYEDGELMGATQIEEAYRLLMTKYRWYEDGDTIDNETANGVEAVVLPSEAKTFRFKFDEGDASVIGFDIIENPNDNTPTFIYDSDTDNKFAVKYLEQKANVGKYYLWCEDYSKPIDEYSRFFFGKLTKIEGTYHLSDYVDHNFLIPSVIELKLDEDETEQWRELDQKDALWQSIYWDRLTEIFKEVISRRYSIGDVINNNNIGFNTRSYTIQPMFVDKIMLDYLVLDELTDTIAGYFDYGYVGVMRLSAEQKFAEITNRQVEEVVLEPFKWYYTENIVGEKVIDTLFQFRKKEKSDIGDFDNYYCYNKLSVYFGNYVSYNGNNSNETKFDNEDMVKNIQPATEDKILEQFVKYFEKKNLFNIGDVINNINLLESKTNAVIFSDEFEIIQLNSEYAYSISAFGKLEMIDVYFSGYINDDDTMKNSGFAKIVGKQENKPTTTQENILLPSQEKFFDFQEGSDLNFVQQTLVRTKMFKDWFGDWELCKLLVVEQQDTIGVQDAIRIYRGVSKAINYNTLEPLVVYHGTKANEEFFIFEANRNDVGRPYSYFSQNIQYAQNFTRFSQRGSGNKSLLYQCFLSIKNPFNARSYGKAEVDRFMDAQTLIDFVADRLYRHHKIGLSLNSIKDVVNSQVGGYIRGVCNTNGDSLGRIPFWMLMAKDSKSTFKYFLISHKFDSIMYEEETSLNLSSADYDDPSKFTIAYAIFDSQQVKLADGRNITFDALNPDIRFEDGGNVTQTPKAEETEQYVSKKENIGNLLKGNQFKYEVGGNTAKMPKTENEMFVESLINKMK
jgi:hypothetical protein